jgi:hypothetical protein
MGTSIGNPSFLAAENHGPLSCPKFLEMRILMSFAVFSIKFGLPNRKFWDQGELRRLDCGSVVWI